MRGKVLSAVGTLAVLLVLPGCSDGGLPVVSGTVKVDDKLIESGSILFTPADGKSRTTGGMITNGNYSVRVPVGMMKVSISAGKVVRKKKIYPTPNSPEMEIKEEILPDKYNEKTELQLEVAPGTNQKDWDLKGK